jgi:hypothetical protein
VVTINATSSTGFILFGPDDSGINDITYSFTTAVPVTGAVALFGTALLGLGLALRRRG